MKPAETARQQLAKKTPPEPEPTEHDWVSTGMTLIDLGVSGVIGHGICKGHVVRMIGPQSSGKTVLGFSIMAEAARNRDFDGYDFVHDDSEQKTDKFDIGKFYGEDLASRVIPPARYKKNGLPAYSRTVGEFLERLEARLAAGRSLIWIEDSLDALQPDTAPTKMTDGKAKAYSQGLRKVRALLSETGSILILMSQVRQNLGSIYGGFTATGGIALEHYATLEFWLRKSRRIFRAYKGKKFPVGHAILCHIKKNHVNGQDRTAFFPFYPDYGLDDVGSCIDFLVNVQHWPRTKGIITARDLNNVALSRDQLIRYIEDGKLDRLKHVTGQVWAKVMRALVLERKPKYR